MEATKKSKLIVIGFMALAVFMGCIAFVGMRGANEEQVKSIRETIAAKGGTVQNIEVVPPDESPFTKSGKGNTIYKISYTKDGKNLTAWFRAYNNSSIIREKEEWIYN